MADKNTLTKSNLENAGREKLRKDAFTNYISAATFLGGSTCTKINSLKKTGQTKLLVYYCTGSAGLLPAE